MSSQYFTPKLAPSDSPVIPLFQNSFLAAIIKDSFKLHTLLAFGAFVQLLVGVLFPFRWAMVPASALLLNALVTTLVQMRNPFDNFAKHVVPGRTSALLPSPLTDTFGPKPSNEPLVVFHLGAQWNHPLGLLAPGVNEIGEAFMRMTEDLHKRKDEYGLINMSSWRASDRPTHNTSLLTFYFRDVEGLHKFAHDEVHRKAWDMFNKMEWRKYMGVFHETFVVKPGGHETVYVNTNPTLLGRGTVKAQTKEGPKYVNTLVSADVPALKSQWSRLGRDANGRVKEDDE